MSNNDKGHEGGKTVGPDQTAKLKAQPAAPNLSHDVTLTPTVDRCPHPWCATMQSGVEHITAVPQHCDFPHLLGMVCDLRTAAPHAKLLRTCQVSCSCCSDSVLHANSMLVAPSALSAQHYLDCQVHQREPSYVRKPIPGGQGLPWVCTSCMLRQGTRTGVSTPAPTRLLGVLYSLTLHQAEECPHDEAHFRVYGQKCCVFAPITVGQPASRLPAGSGLRRDETGLQEGPLHFCPRGGQGRSVH